MSQKPAYPVTHHKTTTVDGVKIFYREAGPKDGPVVLLLHGFPTSSHMFRNLIGIWPTAIASSPRIIQATARATRRISSRSPIRFETFGTLVDGLLQQLGVQRYAMYVMDYGAPVGWQLALKHPDAITGLIVQNGNAYDEGLKEFWDPIKIYWADGKEESRDKLLSLGRAGNHHFPIYGRRISDKTRISPDNWTHDQPLLDRPGNAEIQMDVMYDYRNNLPLYPKVQAWLHRDKQPLDARGLGQERLHFPRTRRISL